MWKRARSFSAHESSRAKLTISALLHSFLQHAKQQRQPCPVLARNSHQRDEQGAVAYLLLRLCKIDLCKLQHQHIVTLLFDGNFIAKGFLIVTLSLVKNLIFRIGPQDWQLHTVVRSWVSSTKQQEEGLISEANGRDTLYILLKCLTP